MDKIIKIFQQLGADESIFIQFGLFIVLFVLLKFVLFNKLLFVLETRENKTTKMEDLANSKFNEADKLAKKFEEEVSQTRMASLDKSGKEKGEAQKRLGEKKSSREKEVQAMYESKKSEIEAEFNVTKENVMKNVAALSDDLVQKLVN